MSEPARQPATYDDVLRAPENMVAEIVAGHLVLSPRPGGPHSSAASALGVLLGGPFGFGRGGPGGWILLDEPELHLGSDVLVPDLAGWRRERLPAVPDTPFFTLAPDWTCEVLSPSSARTDRGDKLGIYAREGVSHIWLVDPRQRTLEVFRLEGGRWVLLGVHRDEAILPVEPFGAIDLELGLLWADIARQDP